MLIPEKLNTLIRILLADSMDHKPLHSILALAKKAKITSAMTKRLLLRLEKSDYLSIRGKIALRHPMKLIKAWGYMYSLREIEHSDFIAAERAQYIQGKIQNWARKENILYAFTLFSATEHVSPFVAPATTHLYILKSDLPLWEQFFRKEIILPAEKEGNVVCFLVNDDYFQGIQDVNGAKIVSLSQLYSDLISFGGRGEEAAYELFKMIDQRLKNV